MYLLKNQLYIFVSKSRLINISSDSTLDRNKQNKIAGSNFYNGFLKIDNNLTKFSVTPPHSMRLQVTPLDSI